MLDIIWIVVKWSAYITLAWWVFLATSIVVSKGLRLIKPKEIWVRHCLPSKDLESVLANGFRRGESEALYQRIEKLTDAQMIMAGQEGADKVSFSTLLDSAFRKMVNERTSKSDTPTYLYVKLPVGLLDTSINNVVWSTPYFQTWLGVGIEYTVDRATVNLALQDSSKVSLEKPKDYVSGWTVLTLFSSWFGLANKMMRSYAARYREWRIA
jgi:hypothetical protein